MIMWICTGLIVFEESRFYTTLELLGVAGSIMICSFGIYLLIRKKKILEYNRIKELD